MFEKSFVLRVIMPRSFIASYDIFVIWSTKLIFICQFTIYIYLYLLSWPKKNEYFFYFWSRMKICHFNIFFKYTPKISSCKICLRMSFLMVYLGVHNEGDSWIYLLKCWIALSISSLVLRGILVFKLSSTFLLYHTGYGQVL